MRVRRHPVISATNSITAKKMPTANRMYSTPVAKSPKAANKWPYSTEGRVITRTKAPARSRSPVFQSTTGRGVPKVISRSKPFVASGVPTVKVGCSSGWPPCSSTPDALWRMTVPVLAWSGFSEEGVRDFNCFSMASFSTEIIGALALLGNAAGAFWMPAA